MTNCPICIKPERPYFRQRILAKYDVQYFFCDNCGFLHAETPYWLEEAYSDAIVQGDTGLVQRNLAASIRTAALFKWMFGGSGKFIDLAGGYGLLTRLMRDFGFDYYWSDRYAQNVFARGFEAPETTGESFCGATAFEVVEHLEHPVDFLRDAFHSYSCDALFFSTELYSGDRPPALWWYYGFNTGQHISFFSRRTLHQVALALNLHLRSNGQFHLLSRKQVNPVAYQLLTGRAVAKMLPMVSGRLFRSKVFADHVHLTGASEER